MSSTALSDKVPWGDATFGDVLLEPTIVYVKRILKLLGQTENVRVRCRAVHAQFADTASFSGYPSQAPFHIAGRMCVLARLNPGSPGRRRQL